jgi:hypothetical protein
VIIEAILAAMLMPQGTQSDNFAFQSELKTLVVFKEGFGFYMREGSAVLEDGWATTNLVPRAASGTFWVYPLNPADRVDTVVTTNDNRIQFKSPDEIKAKLQGKIGLRMKIVSVDEVASEGTLRAVLDDMLLLWEASGGFKAVEYKTIATISLIDFPVRFKLKTNTPNSRAGIGISYIQAGVRWEPSYMMEVLNGNRARLTLRGTLIDLPEELKNANLVFVIGAPNLLNVSQIDWLLQGYMTRFVPGDIDKIMFEKSDSNIVMRERDAQPGSPAAGGGGLGGGGARPGSPPPIQESGELQYYTKPNFSLRPGERAMTTIFESEIPISPFFEWNADGDQVDYIVKIRNTTGNPFTVGPVFVVEEMRPVGQATMEYTANGDEAELRMARAVGIKVESAQNEVSRGDPIVFGEMRFVPIKMQGKLTVENFRNREAEIRISRTVMGRVIEVQNGGKVKDTQVQPNSPNSRNILEWTVKVPAGGKLEVGYSFESYTQMGR